VTNSRHSNRSGTRVLSVDLKRPDPAALEQGACILRRGGLVAFATETVYGLGAVATEKESVARIFAAKVRPAQNPLIVHVARLEEARRCAAAWPAAADILTRRFWPGPLTIVLPRSELIPDLVTAGRPTVALRMPSAPVALGLVERTGKPLAAPSANRSSRISPTTAEHVLGDLGGRIDLILDSGPTPIGLESTVVDLTTQAPRILRPGPISPEELQDALGGAPVERPGATETVNQPSSPGQMAVHYAPRTPSYRVDSMSALPPVAGLEDAAVIVIGPHAAPPPERAGHLFLLPTSGEATHRLYEFLHRCDALSPRSIIVVMPPDEPPWLAVRDRLVRATRPFEDIG
jgi:L-threonylcarbamoyladenylate synthase